MADRPILFSGEMVQAILDGRKTQIRRVVTRGTVGRMMRGNQRLWPYLIDEPVACPYGKPGDLLWVRETWQGINMNGQWWHEVPREERPLHNWSYTNPVVPAMKAIPPRWMPSIHMPKDVCRIFLEVKSVRVERLQDICIADVLKEGIKPVHDGYGFVDDMAIFHEFELLWDSINAKRGFGWWDNPWVWVGECGEVQV